MHANTQLQVPGDGTNELRVGLDWERRGLEPYATMSTCSSFEAYEKMAWTYRPSDGH